MVNPINYIIDTPDPLASVMQGFEAGTAIRRQPLLEQREAEDRARAQVVEGQQDTLFAQGQTLFGQDQDDRAAAQAAAQQEQARAAQMRDEMLALSSNPNASGADYAAFIAAYPEMSEQMQDSWKLLDADNKESTFRSLSEIYATIQNGATPVTEQLLSDRVEALTNSGRLNEAAGAEALLLQVRADPSSAQTAVALSMAAVDPGRFEALLSTLEDQRRDRAAEPVDEERRNIDLLAAAADLDLTIQQTNKVMVETANMSEDAARTVMELEALEASGGLDAEARFDAENKLRKEYVARIGTFPEARTNFDKLMAAATVPDPETGAGDVALVFAFMKMLDPGSVVRESEFALAQNTGGILTRLQNTLTKAERGEFMTPVQRAEMVNLAEQFMQAAQSEADRAQEDLMIPVNNYGLSSENVFGVSGVTDEEPAPQGDALTGAQSLLQSFGASN